jgi:hypothetical protein
MSGKLALAAGRSKWVFVEWCGSLAGARGYGELWVEIGKQRGILWVGRGRLEKRVGVNALHLGWV